jgi:dTDP-glucose 4,6-dehydratase
MIGDESMDQASTYLVTGGAGFIGSCFVLSARRRSDVRIVNLDLLTYAANPKNLAPLKEDPLHTLILGDIGDRGLVRSILDKYRPRAVVNFAAESHVDRSIHSPGDFIMTNVGGTFGLLEEVRGYWESLPGGDKESFRFLHVSTDEVYGSLGSDDPPFHERTPYAPNSPYSASKAAADHLVRAYHHTYGLPVMTTNCSNNYGPRQFPEKLIPLMILNAMRGDGLPVYGDGLNVRDWLYVEDHCDALDVVLEKGKPGEVYNIGGRCEKTNLEMVTILCDLLDAILPGSPHVPHSRLIRFVKDRPGHDRRYAIDSSKIMRELGWQPKETLETGLGRTVRWYLENSEWIESIQTGSYREWIRRQYGEREEKVKGDVQ